MSKSRFEKLFCCLLIVSVLALCASAAFATSASTSSGAPWSNAITKIVNSLTGEVAMALGVVCLVAAGAKMIHGGGNLEGWAGPVLVAGLCICGLAKAKDFIEWLSGTMLFK